MLQNFSLKMLRTETAEQKQASHPCFRYRKCLFVHISQRRPSVALDLRSNNHERRESVNFNCFLCPQACRENHVDVVELLLDYGASVNAPFPNSRLVEEVSQIWFSLKSWEGRGIVVVQWCHV